jgi:spore germination protein
MDIYVVQPGDTLEAIANNYGVTVEKLIIDNGLPDPSYLVPGEVIIITKPSLTYTVQEGDTLASIATANNITVLELLRNNPFLSDRDYLYPGEVLAISYNRIGSVATHGYSNTFIKRDILKKTLPYLTYLTIFNYRTEKDGEVVGTNEDTDMIQLSKEYGVIPLMLMTTLSVQGDVDIELTYEVLINDEVQNRLFNNVLNIVREKGYYGVNISAQYITSENQALFYNYTKRLSDLLKQEGYITLITINPKINSFSNEITFENINYSDIASTVDSTIFLQYVWGINTTPPSPVFSINSMNIFLDYALTQMEPDKIITGIPSLGYIWELPFVAGFSVSNSLTYDSVMNLAREAGVTIEFDIISQTPYFTFIDPLYNTHYIVWFINAITIDSLLRMMFEKDIYGTGLWNIMTYFTQLWLVVNCQYEVIKLLPEF